MSGLLTIAALLRQGAGIDASAVLINPGSIDNFIGELRSVATKFPTIYLVHTDAARARAAQRLLTEATIITDQQTAAILLTAGLLTTLAHTGMSTRASRIVIIGGRQNPEVTDLAVAAGVGEIITWSPDDAHHIPLASLARRATASATHQREATAMVLPPPLIAIDNPAQSLLALPTLLSIHATIRHPIMGTKLFYSCAQALAAGTPDSRMFSVINDPGLTRAWANR
jgi:malate dehydrogenase (oxaloacetate-decarboxylating)